MKPFHEQALFCSQPYWGQQQSAICIPLPPTFYSGKILRRSDEAAV